MCATCGCSTPGGAVLITMHDHDAHDAHDHVRAYEPAHSNDGRVHTHSHDGHEHTHSHDGHEYTHSHNDNDHTHSNTDKDLLEIVPATRTVELERAVLAKNDALAERNRRWFAERGILALNLVSSPGSGKTTLLERTIRDLGSELPIVVIEGDQATENDSARIRAAGARALQVNTGTGCHLEAEIIGRALDVLVPSRNSVVMIENVGNLVCPALFDLGERAKVAILSVTEGDDKPAKYPHMFAAADLFIVNKIDLLPYVDFDVERCIAHARKVNPNLRPIALSARSGENLGEWYDYVRRALTSSASVQAR